MLNWLTENWKVWFDGLGVALLVALGGWLIRRKRKGALASANASTISSGATVEGSLVGTQNVGGITAHTVNLYGAIEGHTARPPNPEKKLQVKVSPAIVQHPAFGLRDVVSVAVQNHSSSSVFVVETFLQMTDGKKLVCSRDDITGEWFYRREVRPGDSYSVNLDPSGILAGGRSFDQFTAAVVRDALDETYSSSGTSLRDALKAASRHHGA